MGLTLYITCAIVVAFLANNASALRCWSCSTDATMECNDHFNGTMIMDQQMRTQHLPPGYDNGHRNPSPYVKECDDYLGRLTHERQVCIKVVRSARGGSKRIIRECRSLPYGQQVGSCHEPTRPGETVDFCEYCDQNECNSANGIKTNTIVASLLPLLLIFLLHK